jgi:hypothetical protein
MMLNPNVTAQVSWVRGRSGSGSPLFRSPLSFSKEPSPFVGNGFASESGVDGPVGRRLCSQSLSGVRGPGRNAHLLWYIWASRGGTRSTIPGPTTGLIGIVSKSVPRR